MRSNASNCIRHAATLYHRGAHREANPKPTCELDFRNCSVWVSITTRASIRMSGKGT